MVQKNERIVLTSRVTLLGSFLVLVGMAGFYLIPGLMDKNASGTPWINAFYCSVITLTTIGFGDICPSEPDEFGRLFLIIFPLLGLGFFCGPILELASSWRSRVPGGPLVVAVVTLGTGVFLLSSLEGFPVRDALHLCVIMGTTIGYGDITPSSDAGRFWVAIYAILMLNVMGGVLDVGRDYLESFCVQNLEELEADLYKKTDGDDDGGDVANSKLTKNIKRKRKKQGKKPQTALNKKQL